MTAEKRSKLISLPFDIWIRNVTYGSKFTGKNIPPRDAASLNDHLMHAAQRPVWNSLGHPGSYQSVLNRQKTLFSIVSEEPIQMLYSRSNHHLLSFNSNKRIQVCVWMPKRCNDEIFEDSLRISPRQKIKSYCYNNSSAKNRKILTIAGYLLLR